MAIGTQAGIGVEAQFVASIGAAMDAGDLKRAYDLATIALSRGMSHRAIFSARGLALQADGRHEQALGEFRRALNFTPRDPVLLNAIALSQLGLEQFADARQTLEKAIAINPSHAYSHYRRGMALAMLGEQDAAESAYERVLELDPNHAQAIASLSSVAARKGDHDKARTLAARALAMAPNEPTALNALAIVEISEKRFVEAERRLRGLLNSRLLSAQARASVLGQLGDSLDGQQRYAEAFAVYRAENAELRQHNAAKFAERGADAARNIANYFETTDAKRWSAPDEGGTAPEGVAGHVFLLGFMRSGTTLLEQVLASNPRIVALEEKGTLNDIGRPYMTSTEGLNTLSRLGGDALAQDRRKYWEQVAKHDLSLSGKIFVDKQPLNTIKLPLIAKLFPTAKIIFALRDPRDVVFSCYRRHFRVNVTMFEFLDLQDAASFYASVMRLAELYREKVPLNLLEHRYETMVEDFEGSVNAVCDFMGVKWADSMRDFNQLAPAVDLRSPSATQVRQPLYREAVAQWRNYREQLSPIFPILQPWVEKFGYPPN